MLDDTREHTYFMGLLSMMILTKNKGMLAPGSLVERIEANNVLLIIGDVIRVLMEMPIGIRETWFQWEMEALLDRAEFLARKEEVDNALAMA